MKRLIFVSLAVGIISGTPIDAQAQKSTRSHRAKKASSGNRSVRFIDNIEIQPETPAGNQPVPVVNTVANDPGGTRTGNETSGIENCTTLQFKYAQLLNREVESINIGLYSFIEKWWATPYRYGGAARDGIDCSAYTGTLIHDIYGITLPRTARSQYDEGYKIKKSDLQEGDLVFFKTRRGVSHVGVYLGNGFFTHASTSSGVVISSMDEEYYSKRYIGARRVPAVTAGD